MGAPFFRFAVSKSPIKRIEVSSLKLALNMFRISELKWLSSRYTRKDGWQLLDLVPKPKSDSTARIPLVKQRRSRFIPGSVIGGDK